jgi:hypothetical protein
MKKAIFFHGYGGEPIPEITELFRHLGYDMIQPDIDFDDEWEFDNGKTLLKDSISIAKECDLIIGLSLGGYLAYLTGNSVGKNCLVINPGIDRSKTQLHIKEFDFPKIENNCNLEVFLGDKDNVIPNSNTVNYINKNSIKARVEIIKNMGHVFDFEELIKIIKMSNFIFI